MRGCTVTLLLRVECFVPGAPTLSTAPKSPYVNHSSAPRVIGLTYVLNTESIRCEGVSRPSFKLVGIALTRHARQYSLSASPLDWGTPLDSHTREADDDLHDPNVERHLLHVHGYDCMNARSMVNVGCMAILLFGSIALL